MGPAAGRDSIPRRLGISHAMQAARGLSRLCVLINFALRQLG
jgi:hypothetical protein